MEENKKPYSQVKAMFAISRASFRAITRSPSAVIFTIAFPLVFIIVFGFIKGNRIRLELGIDSHCDTTTNIFHAIKSIDNIELVQDKNDEELKQLLIKGRVDAILSVHLSNSTDSTRIVELKTSQASRDKGRFIETIISNIIDKQNIAFYSALSKEVDPALLANKKTEYKPAELKETELAGREYKMIDFILPGQLGFSILSAGVFGTAFVFFSLRQTLVLKRFFATPIRRGYIVLGEAISRLVFQLMGALFIVVLGKFAFGFTLVNGFTTLVEILFLAALGLIVFMGFGFVVSGIAKNENVIPPIANIVTLPQMLLCGTFFPIDAFPSWLQAISKCLPLTYLNDALRKVAFEGASLMDVSPQILVIMIWGVLVYFLAVRFFRWE